MVLRPEAIARALIIHGLDDYRQQCACGTFEEVIAEAIGQPGGFQVVFHDDRGPLFGDMGDIAGRGHLPRGADDQQQVAVLRQFFGLLLGRGGNGLPEKDGTRRRTFDQAGCHAPGYLHHLFSSCIK